MKAFFEDPTQNPDDFYNAYLDKENADYDKLYENYDAAVDWPNVSFYKELLKKYPGAKVVLTERSADSWWKSMQNTILKTVAEVPNSDDPSKPEYRFYRMATTICLDGLFRDVKQIKNEEKLKQMFLDHNAEVKRVVPEDQLLVMQLGEGWERLCKFLGKEIPSVPYPNGNSTKEFQERSGALHGVPYVQKDKKTPN